MSEPPRVAFVSDIFYEVNGAALTSREGLLMTPRRTGTDGFFVSVMKRGG